MIKDVKGFTLLELMIAVSLGVILLGIGAPAMSSLLSENSLRFESRTLLKYLRFARSQAIDNQQSVTACLANASDNCVTANPTQLLVFVDNDAPADNILNNSDQFLARTAAFAGTLTISNNRISTTFSPDGTSLGSNATISLCSSGNAQVNLVIAQSGRSSQSTQANVCP
ncbi:MULTISPECIES: GspH/FimT family pseudopilin [Aeromonas]|jgi:type IV fimbrial biogenesis protein FimT|uniref:Type II secretion system protein H n=1 Tax=Aeromonas media TaxID=651 RepID=A0AAP6GEQ3_AERME|nr:MULTISPECIES: GspH/FimT family pseudopilin [Aeromonas]MCK2085359.1 prepilin-type N-terminal cleavage/methylation domain-containing protein [Aeromonas genomosp. paramedia]MDX7923972.1 GspH/FimT family pseudopilin [Aeromonas media]